MGRFLVFFSYIGTHYRGLQVQRHSGKIITRFKTVQGVLEDHIRKLNPANELIMKTSSRTDRYVHALSNSCHIDLVHRYPPLEFDPKWITATLNRSLSKDCERLRILDTVRVPDDFSSRKDAEERSYVYRLAVIKNADKVSDISSRGLPWAVQDAVVTSCVFPPFDTELFLKTAEILTGTHNFLSFSTRTVLKTGRDLSRHIQVSIRIRRSTATLEAHRRHVSDIIDFWDVHFRGKSFLYKQVRRMVGAMVAVAQERMTTKQLQECLDNPSLLNTHKICALPGCGLTLNEVHYPEEVFNYSSSELSTEAPGTESLMPSADDAEQRSGLYEVVAAQQVASSSCTVHFPSVSLPCISANSLLTRDRLDSDGTCADDDKDSVTGAES